MEPMLGMIYLIPFNFAPRDYLLCQGQVVSKDQYSGLFSLFGTTYGGDGQETFALPNLQGRVPLGSGTLAGGATYALGAPVGTEAVTLDQATLPAHTHAAAFAPTTGTQAVTIPATTGDLQVGVTVNATSTDATSRAPTSETNMLSATLTGTQKVYGPTTTSNLVPLGGTSASVTGTASTAANTLEIEVVTGGSVTVGETGGSRPLGLLQPSLALNFIIAVNGVYPYRP
ncbi:phage tail protein [Methylobacterium oryzisoli]|uniref:phage tail protein n=1 Tax=Methylobacterium oryzisoli TaxID=3385502 RepID=UPI0038920E80